MWGCDPGEYTISKVSKETVESRDATQQTRFTVYRVDPYDYPTTGDLDVALQWPWVMKRQQIVLAESVPRAARFFSRI
jgi:hypothetical protein